MRGTEAAWSIHKGLKFITFPHYFLFASLITIITLRCCHKPSLKAAQAKKKKVPYLCMSDLPSQLCCLQLWLHLCAQACPGLQVSRHKIKPCQPADFSAKPAFLLLSNGCTPTAWLLVLCVEEQMSTQLVAVVIAREETATEEAGAEVLPFCS